MNPVTLVFHPNGRLYFATQEISSESAEFDWWRRQGYVVCEFTAEQIKKLCVSRRSS